MLIQADDGMSSRIVKKFHRARINRRIAANRAAIEHHRLNHPENFFGREHLYMADHALRNERDAL